MSTEAPTLTELLQSDSRWLRGTLAACVENTTIKGFVPAIQEVAGRIDAILATQAQVPTAEPPVAWHEPGDWWLGYSDDTKSKWARSDHEGDRGFAAKLTEPLYAHPAIPDSSVDPALIRGDTKGSSDHGAPAPSSSGPSSGLA